MWFKIQDQKVKIRIIAKPNAKKTALLAVSEEGLKIAVHAKPHKGEANKAVILFLSELFGVPKSQIVLESGETSKYKQVIMPLTPAVQHILKDPSSLKTL